MNTISTYTTILETSYRLFAEHGFDKTSMTMIAKEVGLSKPALYYHFLSKEAIIQMLFEELCKSIGFSSFFRIEEYTQNNFEEKFIADGLQIIHKQQTDMYYSRILNQYQALGYRNPAYSQKLVQILEGFTAGFAELLVHGVSIGAIATLDVLTKAQMLTMIIDSMDNFMSYGLAYGYENIWTTAVKSLIKGESA
ncbi:TetR family transcriptional regulator [Paenibacillus ferrarius]|uniref:TetR family transcriptional regulator n=1 Tax=Paenibacillus ferrarius TaxID=1469647 RepID=A0A1V4HFR8_9BACL|nr:TetR/AcrR family transcriptional regulator [Paenibacillus ferrarius]OPH53262.1 TetR family transcriptional regulator [Paenibacillus ferrarius]